jgi:hypothetical protein
VSGGGCSSAGRAPRSQRGGQRFDPAQLHQRISSKRKSSSPPSCSLSACPCIWSRSPILGQLGHLGSLKTASRRPGREASLEGQLHPTSHIDLRALKSHLSNSGSVFPAGCHSEICSKTDTAAPSTPAYRRAVAAINLGGRCFPKCNFSSVNFCTSSMKYE